MDMEDLLRSRGFAPIKESFYNPDGTRYDDADREAKRKWTYVNSESIWTRTFPAFVPTKKDDNNQPMGNK